MNPKHPILTQVDTAAQAARKLQPVIRAFIRGDETLVHDQRNNRYPLLWLPEDSIKPTATGIQADIWLMSPTLGPGTAATYLFLQTELLDFLHTMKAQFPSHMQLDFQPTVQQTTVTPGLLAQAVKTSINLSIYPHLT